MIRSLALPLIWFVVGTFTQGGNHYLFGPNWGMRPYGSKGYIISAETTLLAGKPPEDQSPRLAIWPGLDFPGGVAQPVVVSSSEALYNR